MSLISTISNYGGKQPNNTAYVKQFVSGISGLVNWILNSTSIPNIKIITPSDPTADVLIQNNLIVLGSMETSNDDAVKKNVSSIDTAFCDKLMELEPKMYNHAFAPNDKHFGFLSADFEKLLPDLVGRYQMKQGEPFVKSINFIEVIPLLLLKIQNMQKDIDELKKNNL